MAMSSRPDISKTPRAWGWSPKELQASPQLPLETPCRLRHAADAESGVRQTRSWTAMSTLATRLAELNREFRFEEEALPFFERAVQLLPSEPQGSWARG
jgi:hypothetical protein